MAAAAAPGFVVCCTMPDATTVAEVVSTQFGNVGYVVLEKVNDVQFMRLPQDTLAANLSVCDVGRVFSTAAELRWRRTSRGDFAALLLTEEQSCVPAMWEPLGTRWSVYSPTGQIQLWGERRDGWEHWIEVRIPRALVYPVAKTTGPVYISWVEYRDAQDTVRFIRFKEVQ